jgi:hypothetical protein
VTPSPTTAASWLGAEDEVVAWCGNRRSAGSAKPPGRALKPRAAAAAPASSAAARSPPEQPSKRQNGGSSVAAKTDAAPPSPLGTPLLLELPLELPAWVQPRSPPRASAIAPGHAEGSEKRGAAATRGAKNAAGLKPVGRRATGNGASTTGKTVARPLRSKPPLLLLLLLLLPLLLLQALLAAPNRPCERPRPAAASSWAAAAAAAWCASKACSARSPQSRNTSPSVAPLLGPPDAQTTADARRSPAPPAAAPILARGNPAVAPLLAAVSVGARSRSPARSPREASCAGGTRAAARSSA